MHTGQRQYRGPVGRVRLCRITTKPQIAQQIQHHGRRVQARRQQRQPDQATQLQVELRDIAGIQAVMA